MNEDMQEFLEFFPKNTFKLPKWPRTRIKFICQMNSLMLLAFLLFISYAEGQSPGLTMKSREENVRLTFEIEEGKPEGTFVGQIPTKPNFTYRFNEQPMEFLLNATTGIITTAVAIDRESLETNRFDLVILSSRPTYPLEIRILILDINDFSPEFPEPSIEVSFSENANVGTRVILDTATDRDVGINDVQDYKIVSGSSKFRLVVITNPSGQTPYLHLETTEKLDRETTPCYTLNISAEDGGIPPRMGFLLVKVSVLDVNDNPPIFVSSDFEVYLNESVPPGSSVLKVTATDIDEGENARITYYLENTEKQFTVDPETGVITTLKVLNCQNCPIQGKCPKSCVFTVFARDHGSPRNDGRAYVTVSLVDANDHSPSIRFRYFPATANYATVDENAYNGSVVAAVSIIDLDEGLNGQTEVKIEGGNELNHFRLESTPSFHLLRVNAVLDREAISEYNLTLVVTDHGLPSRSSTAFLVIQVNDINDHSPEFENNFYSAVLSETVPVGTYVASISATDEDTGVNSKIFYSIVSGNERRWFDIDTHSGLVTTADALNREFQDYVELKVAARDGGPNPRQSQTLLEIRILDENDERPFFSEKIINVTFLENLPANTLVTVVTAVDNDLGTNGSVKYFFHPDVNRMYPNKFSLDSTYGRLTMKDKLDREESAYYQVVIIAKDEGIPSLSASVTVCISLLDENDNEPKFYPNIMFRTIHPSDVPGTVIVHLNATDSDFGENAKLRFMLISGHSHFDINEETGIVKTKSHLEIAKYDIKVSVENPNDPTMSDEAIIVVYCKSEPMELKVNNFNFVIEEDPYTKNSAFTEKEVGKVHVTHKAIRPHTGIKFSIVYGDPQKLFSINDQGIIRTVKAVDRETNAFFSLEIVAYDFLGYTKITVNISVLDLNDCKPIFEYQTEPIIINEDSPVGHEVYLIKAYDFDTGLNGLIEYELSTEAQEIYNIDKNGMLYLKSNSQFQVNKEYEVQIIAHDMGVPQLYANITLLIFIQDVNDKNPKFEFSYYETSLLESVPVNNRFYFLKVIDEDYGVNKLINYSISHGNEENKFGIFPDGYLYVRKSLDREVKDSYSLIITATDNGEKPRSSSVQMVIHIMDENDNKPSFLNETYEFFLSENEPPGTYVGRIAAEDLDKGRNSELTYYLNNEIDFQINAKTGIIRSSRYFDREKLIEVSGHDYLVLNAIVMDSGVSRLKDEKKITIFITDVNDVSPQFIGTPYLVSISENSLPETHVIRISAIDFDDGINANIKYSIVTGHDGMFSIDDITGQITVLNYLDRETKAHYDLVVMATDMGQEESLNTTTSVDITLLDENDCAPNFHNASEIKIQISEDAIVGTIIHKFDVSDDDVGLNAEVEFFIATGNFKETFRIDNSGSLYLARTLDHEECALYVINVSAIDSGIINKLTTTVEVVIKVIDINDNAPRFVNKAAVVQKIEENLPPNYPVITLMAEDRDSGLNGKVIFNITEQMPNTNNFAIQADTGLIYTLKSIDREENDVFQLTVTAVDQSTEYVRLSALYPKIVTIFITDVNDNAPSFISMDAGILPAHSGKGYKIMTLSAIDLDSDNNALVHYEIEGESPLFTLDKLSGDLYTSVAIEKPAVLYTIMVKATDQADIPSSRKSSRNKIAIIGTSDDNNMNGPVFSSSFYTGSIIENEPVGTSVLSVHAEYPQNPNDKHLEYFITSVVNVEDNNSLCNKNEFAINRFTGVISTTSVLDREKGARLFELHVYVVHTTASSPLTAKTKVEISVIDANDSPPVFEESPYKAKISETAVSGEYILTVSATDPDTKGSLTYMLVDANENKFRLDSVTGSLYLNLPLDREAEETHVVVVRAHDGIQYAKTNVIIEVIDSNDNAPIFAQSVYSFDILEGSKRGTEAGVVSASDADVGLNAEISYSLLTDSSLFSLNPSSGVLTLASHLDYEEMQHYKFVVQAEDSGTPRLSATVLLFLNLIDENDNSPQFDILSYSHEVFENCTIGTSLLKVSATDIDSGDNGRIVYDIIDGNYEDNKFAIKEDGTIYTAKELDRETESLFILTVQALDQAPEIDKRLSSTVKVTIIVKDNNDNAPVFISPNKTSITENVMVNTVVMAVKAIDKDNKGPNSDIEYYLKEIHPEGDSKFSLGSIDGLLRVAGPIDREEIAEYKVVVVAKDEGHPSLSTLLEITISIIDENDSSPNFLNRGTNSATISEDSSIGLSVLQVFATDKDAGLNSEIRYSIIGDIDYAFSIDEDGIIRVNRQLDYDRTKVYSFTVEAEDSGVDIRRDTISVTIFITRSKKNRYPPLFPNSPSIVRVMENIKAPISLLLIEAYDKDETSNMKEILHYEIKEGNRTIFSLNSKTGELTLEKSLDREEESEYLLTVICIDSGTPRLTGTGTVQIFVDDKNDCSPVFSDDDATFSLSPYTVKENMPPLTPIVTLTAVDKDVGRNAEIKYSLYGEYANRFVIDNNGTIRTKAILDREICELYTFQVVCKDNGLTVQNSATMNVTIVVDDENDNRPFFAKSNYVTYIPDNAIGGHFVFGASAIDHDIGLNGKLVYHLSGVDVDKFLIDHETGIVKLVKKLMNKQLYEIEVHVTDNGETPLSSTTHVTAYIKNHELFPRFLPGMKSFKFAENSKNVVITRVSAVSPKTAEKLGEIKYSIAGGNSGNVFTINDLGDVKLVGNLDRETIPLYDLYVEAKDNDTPALGSTIKLEIHVTDFNDNSPVFSKELYNAAVQEELEPPLFVIKVEASDSDYGVNSEIEYILDSDKENPFSLNPKTGELFTTEVLDRETKDQYKIRVKAIDHGNPQRTSCSTILIYVIDKNDNPPRFTRLFSANVTENAPIGTFVIQVTSSDRDINSHAQARYSFTENPGSKFNIDALSGNVTVAGYIDREINDEFLLKVSALDGSWKAETPLTVVVEDVNDNSPKFDVPEYVFNVPELMKVFSFIGKVKATDYDKKGPNSFVVYSLKRQSSLFEIDKYNGNIFTKQILYYRKLSKGSTSPENCHSIVVIARDHGNPPLSNEITVNINVMDSNRNSPVFEKECYFSPIPESTEIGFSVLKVIANDADVSINADEIEYKSIEGNGTDYFTIHKTGCITVNKSLIGLKDKIFLLHCEARDKGIPNRTATALIKFVITDENLYGPVFQEINYNIVIPENEPLFSEIITVTATDKDKGYNGEVIYSITSGNIDDQFYIYPNNGSIIISKQLDYESINTYHLNIAAFDRGFRSKNASVVLVILVSDVDDNVPTFNSTKYDVHIFENEPPGTIVTQLVAFDADSGRNKIIEYSIIKGERDSYDFFEVNKKTGLITTKVSFDYEQKKKYQIEVIASNIGTLLFGSTLVTIHIIGLNEYYPHFVQPVFEFTVSENAGVGTIVGELKAVDEDSGVDGEINFLLLGDNNINKGFEVDFNSGTIKVARPLDRESEPRVVITVLAKNRGSIRGDDIDEAEIVISIEDGNDPPVFSKDLYEAHVSEAAPLGTTILLVSAVDKDVHPNNNHFSFAILYRSNTDTVFSIDTQTGAVYTSGKLDRETQDSYNLTVTATDSGNPPQTGSTLIKIDVDDENDNMPILNSQNVFGYILENEPPYTSVMVLNVFDKDLPPNGGPFKFSIVGGAHKDYFEIDSGGVIKTTKSLDKESLSELEIVVEIKDSGKPSMSSQNLIKIVVLDKNDNPSTSRPLTILVWIYDKYFAGGKIADVHPKDLDIVGQYQCQITEGNTSIFTIPKNCDLHTTKLNYANLRNSYTLSIMSNDGIHEKVLSINRIKFFNFNNVTLDNSVSLKLLNVTAKFFLSFYLDNFLNALEDILKPNQPILYSIISLGENLEITLAAKISLNSYVSSHDIIASLKDNFVNIEESIDNKKIIIGYNPCDNDPCENNGICTNFLEIKTDSLSILDSLSLVFTSPYVSRQFQCKCKRGFSGPMCQFQQDPCLPNPCLHGGTCLFLSEDSFHCTCTPEYHGIRCDIPQKDLCSSFPCKNGGTCEEVPNGGGFFCLCRPGFKGLICEQTADACRPNRCLNGGTCINENMGYKCACTSDYFGRHCEKSAFGFQPFSYMAFQPLDGATNDISITFATKARFALLLYNFGTQIGGRSDFISLEIINSVPVLSFGGSRTAITRISINVTVSDEKWHKVTIIRKGKVASLSVVNCHENGDSCDECLLGKNSTCSKAEGNIGTLDFNENYLFIGGLETINPVLERPGQVLTHDFVGCIRALIINGRQIDMNASLKSAFISPTCFKRNFCTVSTCGPEGTCINDSFSTSCLCSFGKIFTSSCIEAEKPYSIFSGNFIELIPQERHRRTKLLEEITAPKVLSFHLRSKSEAGIVFYSQSVEEHTALKLSKGKLVYYAQFKSNDKEKIIEELDLPAVNDGQYHKISMAYENNNHVNISVDGKHSHIIKSKHRLHDFLDPYLSSITIGKNEDEVNDILGCVKLISVNHEIQEENHSSSYFKLYHHGNLLSMCQNEALGIDGTSTDPLSIGVILVIVFFVILLIAILISFLVFRRRKVKRDKGPLKMKENGNSFLTNSSGDPHRICASNNDERDVMRNPDSYVPKKLKSCGETTECSNRPDIICEKALRDKRENSHATHIHSNEKSENNYMGENLEAENYDLENASSIAPSDIDLVYYYKGFRDGNINKYKTNTKVPFHKHNHRHSPHKFESNPRNILEHNPLCQQGDSPTSILKMQTPLARLSPSSEISDKMPRILTLEDISGKPLKKALLATAQGVGSKQFQDPMTNSDRSLSHSSSMQSSHQNVNKLKARDNNMTLGLTTEEIERLNARPRNLSLVSTLDAVSSSSDDNANKHKLAELLESNTELLEAQDSSTDESGNDSFTCSEFEYDNYDKVHREFDAHNMIFSKLAEEDNENDEDYDKTYDGFDSFRGSFSTLVASDDESSNPPSYKPANGSILGWDCLLNWGPNFENLVGVFKDIEQLPDNVNSTGQGHSQTDEDYM